VVKTPLFFFFLLFFKSALWTVSSCARFHAENVLQPQYGAQSEQEGLLWAKDPACSVAVWWVYQHQGISGCHTNLARCDSSHNSCGGQVDNAPVWCKNPKTAEQSCSDRCSAGSCSTGASQPATAIRDYTTLEISRGSCLWELIALTQPQWNPATFRKRAI
jgi:hypothetical protein